MSGQAHVESAEALTGFRVALCKAADRVKTALEEAEAEIQRMGLWLTQEKRAYWKQEARVRGELHLRAKTELLRKQADTTPLGGRQSVVEERKALAAAARRLDEARQKIAAVRRWTLAFEKESTSYRGAARGLRLVVESDVPVALAKLDSMAAAVEAYAVTRAPATQRSTADTRPADGASVARGVAADTDAHRGWRRQTPTRQVRDRTPVADAAPAWAETPSARAAIDEALRDIASAPTPVGPDEKIVLAGQAWRHARVYLERIAEPAAGDSGWYLGPADGAEPDGCEAVRVGDLLTHRPDLARVLALPAGFLVVLDGPDVVAVLDPQNGAQWPAAARQAGAS